MTKPVDGAGEKEGMDRGTERSPLSRGVAEGRVP
jgi:hypothetical protein